MSTSIYYEADDDLNKVLHHKCKCGHELYQHGFVSSLSIMGYPHYVLWVSQCVMCNDCKEFAYPEGKDVNR